MGRRRINKLLVALWVILPYLKHHRARGRPFWQEFELGEDDDMDFDGDSWDDFTIWQY